MRINSVRLSNCARELKNIKGSSIDFVMFSPPYDVDKEYEENMGKEKYTNFLTDIMKKLKRVLKKDGRFSIVVPFRCGVNYGRWSRLESVLKSIDKSKMNIRDMIVWNQEDIKGTAWGSWKSASSPNIQYQTEYILVGYNEQWNKRNKNGKSTISNEEFKKWTVNNIWNISPDNNSSHPATYPKELVRRCIKLFTYEDDIVLDPMCGSGTTCVVAKELNRNFICIDKEEKYYKITKDRLDQTSLRDFVEEK